MPSPRIQPRLPMLWSLIDVCLAVVIITIATGAMQFFQEDSITRDNLTLEVMDQWQQQIAVLQSRYERLQRELEQLAESLSESDPETLEAAREQLVQELAELRRELVRLEAAIEAGQQRDDAVDGQRRGLRDSLDHLRRQIEILKAQISHLEAELDKLAYDREQIERLTEEWNRRRRELEEARQEYEELQRAIAAELGRRERPPIEIEVHPRLDPPGNLERILVVLSQYTVTPVREPYYEPMYQGTEQGRIQTGIRFVKTGQPVSEALRPGSEFLRWLDTLDRNRQYVMLDVGADSFETFRAVRAELRKREIRCGWEPDPKGNVNIHFVPGGPGNAITEGIQ